MSEKSSTKADFWSKNKNFCKSTVIAPNFLLNLLLVKMSEKSSTKADFWGKN